MGAMVTMDSLLAGSLLSCLSLTYISGEGCFLGLRGRRSPLAPGEWLKGHLCWGGGSVGGVGA